MPNEGQSKTGRRKNAPSALAAAADDLRRNAGASQSAPTGDDDFLAALSRQAVSFFRWAKSSGHFLKGDELLARSQEDGQEHRVFGDAVSQRYFKITHPDQFEMYPEPTLVLDKVTRAIVPCFVLRKALPSEYLDRLQRQNDLFGDDQQLHGVFVVKGQLHTVISQPALKAQPALKGDSPTREEIYDMMADHGFEIVRSGGSQLYYRPEDNTAQDGETAAAGARLTVGHRENEVLFLSSNPNFLQGFCGNPGVPTAGIHQSTRSRHRLLTGYVILDLAADVEGAHDAVNVFQLRPKTSVGNQRSHELPLFLLPSAFYLLPFPP